MSLILEALRRSEAERRRGAPPGLFDGASGRVAATRPVWPLMLAGVLLGAALAGGVLWWLIGGGNVSDDSQSNSPTPEAPRTANVTPVPSAQREVTAVAVPSAPRASAASPVSASAAASPTATEIAAPTTPIDSEAPSTHAAPALPSAPAASPEPEPDTVRPPDPLTGPAAGDVPRASLGAEALPPLRLSMHVFAETPAQRFAILDGQRVREGDRVTDDLQVLEIRRDGLRLSWQGQVLWLPR